MKKNNGCMTAFWIVAGLLGFVAAIHIAIAFYFLQAKFKLTEVRFNEASSASASAITARRNFPPPQQRCPCRMRG